MQKKTGLLIPAFLLGSMAASAQFKKGDRMVGASIGSIVINSGTADITVDQIGTTTSKTTGYNISLNPTLGWFISDNTAVGASLNINPTSSKTTYKERGSVFQSDETSNFNIGGGGFVRHYLKHSGSLAPFGQLGLNLGFSNLKTEGFFYGGSGAGAYKSSYEGNSNGGFFFNSTIQAGMTKMVGEHTGLDFYIGYNFSYNKYSFNKVTQRDNGNNGTIDETSPQKVDSKFTNHGFLVGVGFQVFLKGKK